MKILFYFAFLAIAAGCDASAGTFTPTGTTGLPSSGGTTTGGAFDGGEDAGDRITASVGSPCDPQAVVTPCAAVGLICDDVADLCRLPTNGEPCDNPVGCDNRYAGLGCYQPTYNGQPESLCLVPCRSTDSSGCPYGSSCGDPNLPGYCSTQGTPGCTPWGACTLGPDVSGDCLPDGNHPTCFANGTLTAEFASCDTAAVNSASGSLCAQGSICQAAALTLGATPVSAFCFRTCGADAGSCSAMEHCDQTSPTVFGLCQPGLNCLLSADTCPTGTVCVPDGPTSLQGGCLTVANDGLSSGASCPLPTQVTATSACASGACLSNDAGASCTALCDLADGGRPYCAVGEQCTPLANDAQLQVVGACR